jgi:7-carboxy-7-deazaguanine synthase
MAMLPNKYNMTKDHEMVSDGLMLPLVEEFFTLQGEGFHTGRAAWFIRLGGCDVGCNWCDSRFSWNPDLHPLVNTDSIIDHAAESGTDSVVVTGGEPLKWNLDYLCDGLKNRGLMTFLETSGSCILSGKWDWICLSPKKNSPPVGNICEHADELKVIIHDTTDLAWAEKYRSMVSKKCLLFLQPEWSRSKAVIPEIVEYIKRNPAWRISLQAHKFIHIP